MKILLADDDSSVRRVLQFKLEQKGFKVVTAADGEQALSQLRQGEYDLLLSDIRMPKLDGIDLLERVKSVQPNLKVILITAHATVSQAVNAVKLGAFDYITKPFEDEELFVAIEKALEFKNLESENRQLRGKLKKTEQARRLIGVSRPFKEMMSLVKKVAASDATILLTGESGTGKEMVARTIHDQSARSENDLVAINCAAIPKELLESELFGHTKGAFTGAVRDKKGKFELADCGTLLLDEIGDLARDLQAKLLRVLQEHVVEPVGSETTREVDVRLIAATNVNLQQRVADGTFREDLFYRLNVVPIHVPGLRERIEDIPLLAKEFLRRIAAGEDVSIDRTLMDALIEHRWPGNVRELENLIERMVVLRQSNVLTVKDLPGDFGTFDPRSRADTQMATTPHLTYQEAEKKLVTDALEKCGWNKTRAAKFLDIPRHVLVYRIKKYDISEETSV